MSKKVAILQSNYIPWKGYFDLIACVDEFIIYDEMQYTKRDWRNRNKIKTPTGLKWLTIPVQTKGNFKQKISETKVDGIDWRDNHWKSIEKNYSRSTYFEDVAFWLKPLYQERTEDLISEVNKVFIQKICNVLNIKTKISCSSRFNLVGDKSERLANICSEAEGNIYVSGKAAFNYLNLNDFAKRKIKIEWFHYDNYKEYNQLWGPFLHNVTVLDLIFNCNNQSRKYLRY